MAPLRGWAPRPAPAGQDPHGRWKTLAFIAALRHDRLVAPCLIEGPINGESFLLYVERSSLCPPARPHRHHRQSRISSGQGGPCCAVGARLFFLPKYSPDLNPIEMFFAKLKQ
jgi:transposase